MVGVWHTPVINPAFWKWKAESQKFKVRPGYIASSRTVWAT